MRSKRQIIGGILVAVMLAVAAPASADPGQAQPGGKKRSSCAFLDGILMKLGTPDKLEAVFERITGCDLGDA